MNQLYQRLLTRLCRARRTAFAIFNAGILDERDYLRLMEPMDRAIEELEWAALSCRLPG